MNFSERLSKLKREAAFITTAAAPATASTAGASSSPTTTTRRKRRKEGSAAGSSSGSTDYNVGRIVQQQDLTVGRPSSFPAQKVRRIYLACPPNVQTGGPEAMHQLCDKINAMAVRTTTIIPTSITSGSTNPAVEAYMLYIQPVRDRSDDRSYYGYHDCPHARPLDAYSMIYPHIRVCQDWKQVKKDSSSLLIWPECWTDLMTTTMPSHVSSSYYYSSSSSNDNNNNRPNGRHAQEEEHIHVPMRQAIWWLSVDNNRGKFQDWHRQDILHLYQSEYAKCHILKHLNHPKVYSEDKQQHSADYSDDPRRTVMVMPMTEYIPNRHDSTRKGLHRDLEVLYNPFKGLHYTDEIRKRSDKKFRFTPIGGGGGGGGSSGDKKQRLSPQEVQELLHRGKVYIDFGNHPGMDRLPREAAMAGCIVITNREGAAYYDEDVPIPSQYKLGGTLDVDRIHVLLKECIEKYEEKVHDFDEYRKWIDRQESRMECCVQDFLSRVSGLGFESNQSTVTKGKRQETIPE